jgi:hypothetical protein
MLFMSFQKPNELPKPNEFPENPMSYQNQTSFQKSNEFAKSNKGEGEGENAHTRETRTRYLSHWGWGRKHTREIHTQGHVADRVRDQQPNSLWRLCLRCPICTLYPLSPQVTLVATTRLTLDWIRSKIIYRCLLDSVLRTIAELTHAYEKTV